MKINIGAIDFEILVKKYRKNDIFSYDELEEIFYKLEDKFSELSSVSLYNIVIKLKKMSYEYAVYYYNAKNKQDLIDKINSSEIKGIMFNDYIAIYG